MKMKNLLIPAFIAVTAMASANELNLSNFLTNTRFSGDARVKYETTSEKNKDNKDKLDARFRLNLNTKINDNFSFGSRLVTEETIGDGANATAFTAQRLFMTYKTGNHNLTVGRMGSPLFVLNGRFIDINVEGIAYSTKIQDTQIKAGYLVQDKNANKTVTDAKNTIYAQGVHTLSLGDNKLDLEATLYLQQKADGSTAKDNKDSDLTVFTLGAQYTMDLGADAPLEMVRTKAQYLQSDAKTKNTAYHAGVVFGSKNLNNKGSWQGVVEYTVRETNSFMFDIGKNNTEFLKFGALTYVAPRTNLEVTYEMSNPETGAKKDANTLSIMLNHSF